MTIAIVYQNLCFPFARTIGDLPKEFYFFVQAKRPNVSFAVSVSLDE
jgi:hypothetical protein